MASRLRHRSVALIVFSIAVAAGTGVLAPALLHEDSSTRATGALDKSFGHVESWFFGSLGDKYNSYVGRAQTDFGSTDNEHANAVLIQPDGNIVAAGGVDGFELARYSTSGTPDRSFGTHGMVRTTFDSRDGGASAAAIQADGKIVVVGTKGNGFALARYTTTGALDPSFGRNGKVLTPFGSASEDQAAAVAIQPDGKIVVAGTNGIGIEPTGFEVARYTTNGTLDPSFGDGGRVITYFGSPGHDTANAVALDPNGTIVVAGGNGTDDYVSTDFELARYTPSGTLDTSFGTGGKVLTRFGSASSNEAKAIAIQPDGKIVAAGYATTDAVQQFALARYTTSGTLDADFGTDGEVLTTFYDAHGWKSSDEADAVAIQPDGKIVAAGTSTAHEPSAFALARYTASGAIDTSFGRGGNVLTDLGYIGYQEGSCCGVSGANAVAIQPDGKIVAAGVTNIYDDSADGGGSYHYGTDHEVFALARYLP